MNGSFLKILLVEQFNQFLFIRLDTRHRVFRLGGKFVALLLHCFLRTGDRIVDANTLLIGAFGEALVSRRMN